MGEESGFDLYNDVSGGFSSPADFGGVPTVMPTNNWWDKGIQSVTDVAKAYFASGGQRATANSGPINRGINPPPGFFGLFPQAGSAPGGVYDRYGNPIPSPTGGFGADKMAIVIVVFVVVLVVMMARK